MLTKDAILYKKAFTFAGRIVKMHRYLIEEKREFVLSKQIIRRGTSIDASVSEANGANTSSDFTSKNSIAYKESLETKYRLFLLKGTANITEGVRSWLHQNAEELSKILFPN